jgi:cardiolipin synthase
MNPATPSAAHLLIGGRDLFAAMVHAMERAQRSIAVETYIFDFRGSATAVAEALVRAALRGVRVHLLVDGVGTGQLPALWQRRFADAGVHWHVYSPLTGPDFWALSRWRRLHRKLCVVDGHTAFCGGINLVDDGIDRNFPEGLQAPRLDYAVQVHGQVASDMDDAAHQLWSRLEALRELKERDMGGALEALRSADQDFKSSARGSVQLVLRDNVRHRTRIESAYRKALASAQHDVVLASAYFFPSVRLKKSLLRAAQRGVRVRLLLQGRYEYFWPYRASRHLYAQLLAAGIEIYEYQASVLHAKVAVVDGQWATVGSSNLDPFSLLLAREANVVVREAAFAEALQASLDTAIVSGSVRVDPLAFTQRPLVQRWVDRLASGLLRFGVLLTGKRY